MARMKPAWTVALWAAVAFAACKSGPSGGHPSDAAVQAASIASSAPSSSASARAPRPTQPAPKPEEVTIATPDGVKLSASFYAAGDGHAPAVVLAHRMAGSRTEWQPLLERLFPPKHPMNVLALDLRGHGNSMQGKGKGASKSWAQFSTEDFAAMSRDIQTAVQWLDKRKGGPASSLVLVGSDMGATAETVASEGLGPRLRGIALISPGAALRGVDLYRPFGHVLGLPNLIVTAVDDTTSAEPAQALGAMSKTSRLVRFAGAMHGAEFLGRENPLVWDEIADWVEARVAEQPPPTAASGSAKAPQRTAVPATSR